MQSAEATSAEATGAEVAAMRKLLLDNLLTHTELSEVLRLFSEGAFSCADFHRQLRGAIASPMLDDAFMGRMVQVSQCDQCGSLRTKKPRMLTCAGCRGYHYCDRTCQKLHWKNTHKAQCTRSEISKPHFRVTTCARRCLRS